MDDELDELLDEYSGGVPMDRSGDKVDTTVVFGLMVDDPPLEGRIKGEEQQLAVIMGGVSGTVSWTDRDRM